MRVSLGTPSFSKAKELSEEQRPDLAKRAKDKRTTLDEAAAKYAAARADKGKDHTLEILRNLEIPGRGGKPVRLGDKLLADVDVLDIEAAVAAYRLRSLKRRAGGKVGERKLLQTARHLFNWSIKRKLTTHTPFRINGVTVDEIKPVDSPTGRTRRLEAGEEERLLAAADPWTRDIIGAILDTGLRGHELRGLQWCDVRGDRIIVPPEKQKRGMGKKVPKALVKPIISERLRETVERRRKGPDGKDLGPDAFVFGKATGEQMPRRVAHTLWSETRERAGIAGLNFHDLRAEHGSQMLEAGIDLKKVSNALGHTTIGMTQRYLRSNEGEEDVVYGKLFEHRARNTPRSTDAPEHEADDTRKTKTA